MLAGGPLRLEIDARGFVVDGAAIAPVPPPIAEASHGIVALVLDVGMAVSSTRELLARWRGPEAAVALAEADIPGIQVVLGPLPETLPAAPDGEPVAVDKAFARATGIPVAAWTSTDEVRAGRAAWATALRTFAPFATVVRAAAAKGADEALCAAVAGLVERMVAAGDLDAIVRALTALGDLDAAAAAPIESALETALASDAQLGPLVALLERQDTRASASALLHMLTRVEPQQLLSRVRGMAPGEGWNALAGVLRERTIRPETLMEAADASDPLVFGFVALVACRSRNEPAWDVIRKKGLVHDDPRIREATLAALTRMDARKLGRGLDPLLHDKDAEVRRLARDLVVRRGDAGPGPKLAQLLAWTDLETAERKSIIAALGVVGGSEPQAALMSGVANERDSDLKVACALALGSIADSKGEAFLKDQAARTLIRRSVRDACETALERCKRRAESKKGKPDLLTTLVGSIDQGAEAVTGAAKKLVDEDPAAIQEAVSDLGQVLEQKDLPRDAFRAVVAALVVLRGEHAAEVLRAAYRRIKDLDLRAILVWSLGQMGDADTTAFLQAEGRSRAVPPELRQAIKQSLETAPEEPSAEPAADLDRYLTALKTGGKIVASTAADMLKSTVGAVHGALGFGGSTTGAVVGTAVGVGEALHAGLHAGDFDRPDWDERNLTEEQREAQRRERMLERARQQLTAREGTPSMDGELDDGAPTEDLEQEAPEETPPPDATPARRRRGPDLGHMFANYVYFEHEGQHTFGCRYGSDQLVDVHTYAGDGEHDAYTKFFKDKIAAGFVPTTQRRKLESHDLIRSLDETLLYTVYEALLGAST